MYDRQAAKEGFKQTVIGDLPIGKDRHFDPKEMRKLFILTNPKRSDLHEKFQGRGIVPDQERHKVLRQHEAVLDIFSHDALYTSTHALEAESAAEPEQKPLPENEDPRSFIGRRFSQCCDDGDDIVLRFGTIKQFFPSYESEENIEKWSVRFDYDDDHKRKENGEDAGDEENEIIIVTMAELNNGVDLYETNKLSDPN